MNTTILVLNVPFLTFLVLSAPLASLNKFKNSLAFLISLGYINHIITIVDLWLNK